MYRYLYFRCTNVYVYVLLIQMKRIISACRGNAIYLYIKLPIPTQN